MNIYKTVIDGKVLSDAFYAVGGYDYTVAEVQLEYILG